MHGLHVNGFPNAFIVQLTQGSNHIANVPHNLAESATTIAAIVAHAVEHDHQTVEVSSEAEQAWLDLMLGGSMFGGGGGEGGGGGGLGLLGSLECTPGYYNNEGQPPAPTQRYDFLGYPTGALGFFQYIDGWRSSGSFEGLTFT